MIQFRFNQSHNDLPNMIRKNFKNRFAKLNLNDMKSIQSIFLDAKGITHTDIKRIRQGKLGAQFWVSYASCESLAKDATRYYFISNIQYLKHKTKNHGYFKIRIHMEQIDVVKRFVKKYSNEMQFAVSTEGALL